MGNNIDDMLVHVSIQMLPVTVFMMAVFMMSKFMLTVSMMTVLMLTVFMWAMLVLVITVTVLGLTMIVKRPGYFVYSQSGPTMHDLEVDPRQEGDLLSSIMMLRSLKCDRCFQCDDMPLSTRRHPHSAILVVFRKREYQYTRRTFYRKYRYSLLFDCRYRPSPDLYQVQWLYVHVEPDLERSVLSLAQSKARQPVPQAKSTITVEFVFHSTPSAWRNASVHFFARASLSGES
jgi:hypothetical protein